MKYISVEKKIEKKRKIFISEGIRTSLPKPKIPLVLFWNIKPNINQTLGKFNFLDLSH